MPNIGTRPLRGSRADQHALRPSGHQPLLLLDAHGPSWPAFVLTVQKLVCLNLTRTPIAPRAITRRRNSPLPWAIIQQAGGALFPAAPRPCDAWVIPLCWGPQDALSSRRRITASPPPFPLNLSRARVLRASARRLHVS
ncbi:hypothetical protein AURDEDRAFT_168541 [Auricularia subglabra TFB-10046 SS5]|nr:hypothetical protein AURDEDRAFT_168541 [Auricularia subglabra TFB-10046 SS5]